jgi:NAD+--dinitrogen-reductase ADP-D-ribosyltransferase
MEKTTPFNLCSLPPWAIASRHFNRHPQPLEIQGVRQANHIFFERLDLLREPGARGQKFHDYMDVHFQLHQWQRESSAGSRKSLKNSYLRFLKGWMFDSNAAEGAVLKGWVESRLGLPPTFHRQPIGDLHGEAYQSFQIDRMQGAARTNAIFAQLDLLYEFVQYELRRRSLPQHLTLFRGIHDFAEHRVLEQYDRRHYLLRLNNLRPRWC